MRRHFMMRRRILLWMGLVVLFVSLALCGNALAKETYAVQQGDTIVGIAAKSGVTPDALKAANRLKNNRLQVNQVLVIPPSKSVKTAASKPTPSPRAEVKPSSSSRTELYAVKKGDTLAGISRKTGASVAEIRELNRIQGTALKVGQKLALKKKTGVQTASAEPFELSKSGIDPALELEEEDEADDLLTPEEAWAEIERRKQDNAALLGKWSNPDEQKLLVKVAMGFLGAPYRLGGSSVTGIDCSAFVKKIYQFFNIDLPRTAFEQYHVGMRVARNDLTEGDLIFFKTRKPVGHVGIYIGNNQFVHAASRKKGVRVDDLNQPYYDRRFIRAVRLKGSDGGL
jgi:peptidoglycan DL-endopeptidase LytE